MVHRCEATDSRLFVDTGKLLFAVLGQVVLLPTLPARSVLEVHRRVKALQLLVLLAADGALAWCSGAGASPAAAAAARLAPLSRIAAVSLHERDEVIARHGFKVELLLRLVLSWRRFLHAVKRQALL